METDTVLTRLLHHKHFILFLTASLFGLVLCIACYQLTETPPTWYDEGMILQLAENVATHGVMALQLAPGEFVSAWHVSTGYPVVMPVALAFKFFGIGIFQARAVAVLFILLLISAGLLLLSSLYGIRFAFWGVFLVATFSSLYGNGKNILGEIPGLAFLVLFLFCLERLVQSAYTKTNYALAAGIFLGLAMAAKPTFLPIVPAFLLTLLMNRQSLIWKRGWISIGIGGVVASMLVWCVTQFTLIDSPSQILHFYANPYHLTHVSEVIQTNLLRFFREPTPLYTLLTFGAWMIALCIRKYKQMAEPISISELCAFFFTMLILVAFLRTPGWYRYLFPANILILLFLPSALWTIVDEAVEKFEWRTSATRIVSYVTTALLLLMVLFQSYYMFFGSWIAGTSGSSKTAALTTYFSTLSPQKSVYVYDAPEVVPFLKTDNYYQYFSAGGVWVAGTEHLQDITHGLPTIVVVNEGALAQVLPLAAAYRPIDKVAGKYVILEHK